MPSANGMSPVAPSAMPMGTTAEPAQAKQTSPYIAFIEAMQATQERNTRAIQDIAESRQANLAVIRSMQTSDANTVAAFEKLVTQMKDESASSAPNRTASKVNPAPVAPPTPVNPAIVTPPPSIPVNVLPSVSNGAIVAPPKDMQSLMQELDQLSQKVKDLSTQVPPPPAN